MAHLDKDVINSVEVGINALQSSRGASIADTQLKKIRPSALRELYFKLSEETQYRLVYEISYAGKHGSDLRFMVNHDFGDFTESVFHKGRCLTLKESREALSLSDTSSDVEVVSPQEYVEDVFHESWTTPIPAFLLLNELAEKGMCTRAEKLLIGAKLQSTIEEQLYDFPEKWRVLAEKVSTKKEFINVLGTIGELWCSPLATDMERERATQRLRVMELYEKEVLTEDELGLCELYIDATFLRMASINDIRSSAKTKDISKDLVKKEKESNLEYEKKLALLMARQAIYDYLELDDDAGIYSLFVLRSQPEKNMGFTSRLASS